MELFNYKHNDPFFFVKENDILRRYKSSNNRYERSFRCIRVDFCWSYINFDNIITSDGGRYENFIKASKYAKKIPNFYYPSYYHCNNIMIAGWYNIYKNSDTYDCKKSNSIKYASHIASISKYYNFTHSLLINKIKKKWKIHFQRKLFAIIFIQNRWSWIVSCPRYQICRSRLFREIDIINNSHFI